MIAISLRCMLLKTKLLYLKLLLHKRNKSQNKYKKRYWIRKLNLDRKQKGEYNILVKDLKLFDHELFFRYFRMSPTILEELLSWVCPLIKKKSTHMRDSISAPERFCVTMCFLVTGDAQTTIAINSA